MMPKMSELHMRKIKNIDNLSSYIISSARSEDYI